MAPARAADRRLSGHVARAPRESSRDALRLVTPFRATAGGLPQVRLGLIGCGTVGGAFAAALLETRSALQARAGARLALVQVAVAHPGRPRTALAGARVHADPSALAADPEIDVVVEATGAEEAAEWLRTAHARGASVVTANKRALSQDPWLLELLAARDPRLYCEAAVAGAVPVVRGIRESLAGDRVRRLRGVLNGTTTYVLSALENGGTLARAVREAQEAGYAEADPTLDLNGQDAAAKLAILATLAWGEAVPLARVATRGIEDGVPDLVARARRAGARVRLVAEARRDGSVDARVAPVLLEPADALASTAGVENAVEVDTILAGRLLWKGPGAGGPPTASALLADMIAAARARAGRRAGRRVP